MKVDLQVDFLLRFFTFFFCVNIKGFLMNVYKFFGPETRAII